MIDYSKYTRQELNECLRNVDRDRFPDNYNQIVKHLSLCDSKEVPSPVASASNGNEKPSDDYKIADAVIQKMNIPSTNWMAKIGLGVLGIILSIAVIASSNDAIYSLSIIPVLFIHELGHLFAMKFLGYKNMGIFFIPGFGALTTGIPVKPSKQNEAIVSLAGPISGVLSGICFGVLFHYTNNKWLLYLATYSFVINLFNLIPVLPLDGGRFWDSIVTSRNYLASIIFKVVCAGILLVASIKLQTPIFALLGAALLGQIYAEQTDRRVRSELQLSKAGILTSDRDTDLRKICLVYNKLIKNGNENRRLQIIANRTQQLYENTLSELPTMKFSIAIGFGYFAIVYIAFLLTGISYLIKQKLGH